jgi:hypothetical protein
MKSWANIHKEAYGPWERKVDICNIARISPKCAVCAVGVRCCEVTLTAVARTRLRANHPSWVANEWSIGANAFIRLAFEKGKVILIFKEKKKRRISFLTAVASIDNPHNIQANAHIGLKPNQIEADALVTRIP